MSVQAISWAMAQTTGSITRKAVLMSLANCHNHHTGKCCPKVATVAAELECNERTVKRALADLEEHGFIRRDRSRSGQRQGVNHYTLQMDSLSSQGDFLSVSQGDTVAPQEPEEDLEPSEVPNGTSAAGTDSAQKTPLQLLFDACELHAQKAPLEKSPRAAYAKLVREMFAVGRTPDWVRRTAKAYHREFPQCRLTVAALAKWGEELDRGKRTLTEGGEGRDGTHQTGGSDAGVAGPNAPSVSVLQPEENARRMRELAERTVGALDGAGAFLSTPAPSSAQPHGSQSGALTGEPAPTLPVGSPHPS